MRRWLIRLCYPRAWRLRYEEEFVALLEQERLTAGVLFDIVRGGLDARRRQADKASMERTQAAGRGGSKRKGRIVKRKPQFMTCSFCAKSKEEVQRLVAGPGVCICDACIAVCNEIIAEGGRRQGTGEPREGSAQSRRQQCRCSFCGKAQDLVRRLIAGPDAVHICDACIVLCNEMFAGRDRTPGGEPRALKPTWWAGARPHLRRVLGLTARWRRERRYAWRTHPSV